MLVVREQYGKTERLSELPTSFTEAVGIGFEEGMAYNPTNLLQDLATKSEYKQGEMVFNSEAKKIAESLGVDISESLSGPENAQISKDAVYMLSERKYQSQKRQELLTNGPSGMAGFGASLTGNIAASFLDPIGFAANFIPFVGQSKQAAIIGKAGLSVGGRIAARAGIGAIEGAAGAAVLEPMTYYGATELGEQYTAADSLMNIVGGGVLGAGLHATLGAPASLKEAVEFKKLEQARIDQEMRAKALEAEAEQARIDAELRRQQRRAERASEKEGKRQAELDRMARDHEMSEQAWAKERAILYQNELAQMTNLSRTAFDNIEHAAMAMGVSGRPIDIEPLLRLHVAEQSARIETARSLDPVAFDQTQKAQEKLQQLSASIKAHEQILETYPAVKIARRLAELDQLLRDPNTDLKIRKSLEQEEKYLNHVIQTNKYDTSIKDVEQFETRIEYMKGEIDRIKNGLSETGFNKRVSDAYYRAGEIIREQGKNGHVVVRDVDAAITNAIHGRMDLDESYVAGLVDTIDIDAEVAKHNDNWANAIPGVDERISPVIEETKKRHETKANLSGQEKLDEIARELKFLAEQYKINPDSIMVDVEEIMASGKESKKIANGLSACFTGAK